MNRRDYLITTGLIASGGLAGCSEDKGYGECYKDCGKVKNLNSDSESGLGKTYTDVTITFKSEYSGKIILETYDVDDEVNGYKEKEVDSVMAYTIGFNKFKTSDIYKVYLEEE